MFTEAERGRLLEQLTDRARADPAVAAAAVVGSAAHGAVDRWSDIDLALGLSDAADVLEVADRWTEELGDVVTVADTLDVWSGVVLYRVFLLHHSLQVDLSFWPAGTLAPSGSDPLTVLFGDVAAPTPAKAPDPRITLGWGWLYALHGRAAIARGRTWQAVHMLNGLRDQALELSCLRHGLPSQHGRGVDQLPPSTRAVLARTQPADLGSMALVEAFDSALEFLADEAEQFDPALAGRLRSPFAAMRAGSPPPAPAESFDTCVVFMLGYPGMGKRTVGSELATVLDGVLVDNALINRPVLELFRWDGVERLPAGIWERTGPILDTVLHTIEDLAPPSNSYVFTNVIVEGPEAREHYDRIRSVAHRRGSLFLAVMLDCDIDVQVSRIDNPDRVALRKGSDPEGYRGYRLHTRLYQPPPAEVLHLDTTSTPASVNAARILEELRHRGFVGPAAPSTPSEVG